jgi:hypothetical protein
MDQVEMIHQDDLHVLDPMLNAPCFGCKNKRQRTPQAFQVTTERSRPQRRCCIVVGRAGIWRTSQLRPLAGFVADGSYIMSQTSSAAWQNLLQATLAEREKLLMEIFSSTRASAKLSSPLAIAPTKTQMLSLESTDSTYSRTLTSGASKLKVTLRQLGGKWSVMGF